MKLARSNCLANEGIVNRDAPVAFYSQKTLKSQNG